MPKKTDNNFRIIPIADAYVETMAYTPAKFQKDPLKTVRGVASTWYPLSILYKLVK